MEAAKNSALERQHLATRLSQVFSAISPRDGSKSSTFYTDEEGLFFIFDNGIDPDPAFSGPVHGQLFIDAKKNLSLKIQPLESLQFRKETLFRHTANLKWEFLANKNEKFSDKNAKPINSLYEWRSMWPKEKPHFPSLIRLQITEIISEKTKKVDNLEFAFFLPIEEPVVTYTEVKQI